jgi:hypothetical protein
MLLGRVWDHFSHLPRAHSRGAPSMYNRIMSSSRRFQLTLPLGGPNPCTLSKGIQPTAPRVTCSAHGRTLLVALRCAWLAGSGPSSSRRFSKA